MPTRAIAACHGRIADVFHVKQRVHNRVRGNACQSRKPDADNACRETDDDGFGVEYAADIALARANRA